MSLITLDTGSELERRLAVNSAGLPSLTPQKRHHNDRQGYSTEYHRRLEADGLKRRQDATTDAVGGDRSNKQRQLGNPLHSAVIVKRLMKLNPNLRFEVAKADTSKLGVYILDTSIEEGRRFLTGFENGISPEFSTTEVDADGETVRYIPGWRTVLSKLIKARLVNAVRAELLFGPGTRKEWQIGGYRG